MILGLQVCASLVGCTGENQPEDTTPPDYSNVSDALGENITIEGSNYVLKAKGFKFVLENASDKYSIKMINDDGTILAFSDNPVYVTIADSVTSISVDETIYECKYDGIYSDDKGNLLAAATVTTSQGSILDVTDTFTFVGNSIDVNRSVSVRKAVKGNIGFSTHFMLRSNIDTERGDYDDCEYFIPSILYKDGEYNASASIGSSMRVKQILVKETRTGLPMVMMRKVSDGATVSIVHRNPEISSPDERNYNAYTVDDLFKHGSVGIVRDPSPQICYTYPNFETQGYFVTTGNTKRFAELKTGNSINFTIGVYGNKSDNYTDAMVSTYKENYANQTTAIANVDLEDVYETSVSDLNDLYCYNSASGACGFPFATYVDSGKHLGVSYQIGFIGMNTSLATQLIRYGVENSDNESYQNGFKIIDFWVNNGVTDSGVIKIWAYENGTFSSYPSYLRTMADGAEGILSAYNYLKSTKDVGHWLTAVTEFADFLVNNQLSDGSWYRAYDWGGNMYKDDNAYGLVGDKNTVADSKLNTPVVIRFLLRMYETTGSVKYYNAAVKAGEFTVNNLSNAGKYVGGTPDNPNCIDREAGIYALYAFNALYNATGDAQYLYYAEQAAVFTISWMYTYKFAINETEDKEQAKPLVAGNCDGLSVIATGHSSVDSFMAYVYYELFKLYAWTEDDVWYNLSLFVQNNTKQTVACVANLNYAYDSFAIEATSIADFYFVTAEGGCWLPWITNANIEPYVNMLDVFGSGDVSNFKGTSFESLRATLKNNYV